MERDTRSLWLLVSGGCCGRLHWLAAAARMLCFNYNFLIVLRDDLFELEDAGECELEAGAVLYLDRLLLHRLMVLLLLLLFLVHRLVHLRQFFLVPLEDSGFLILGERAHCRLGAILGHEACLSLTGDLVHVVVQLLPLLVGVVRVEQHLLVCDPQRLLHLPQQLALQLPLISTQLDDQ